MTADTRALRLAVVATARQMNALGLNRGTSGNVSTRVEGGFLVTPSALAYDRTDAEDVVFVASDGVPRGRRRPSSEWRFHRDIYGARGDVQAIVHTHSPFATTLSVLRRPLPPFIANRPKTGFQTPLGQWLDLPPDGTSTRMRSWARTVLERFE